MRCCWTSAESKDVVMYSQGLKFAEYSTISSHCHLVKEAWYVSLPKDEWLIWCVREESDGHHLSEKKAWWNSKQPLYPACTLFLVLYLNSVVCCIQVYTVATALHIYSIDLETVVPHWSCFIVPSLLYYSIRYILFWCHTELTWCHTNY